MVYNDIHLSNTCFKSVIRVYVVFIVSASLGLHPWDVNTIKTSIHPYNQHFLFVIHDVYIGFWLLCTASVTPIPRNEKILMCWPIELYVSLVLVLQCFTHEPNTSGNVAIPCLTYFII